MASSRPRRRWPSSLLAPLGSASSSCSGSSADLANLADEVALGLVNVGQVHAPARQEHAEKAYLAADAVRPLLARLVVGADPQIAALAIIDALGRYQPLGANERRRRRAFGRPGNRAAGDGLARSRVPVTVERHPAGRAGPRRVDAADGQAGLVGHAEDRAGGRGVILAEAGVG